MEILKAKDYTLSALTLNEKELAEGLLHNKQYNVRSRTVWIRSPVLNLKKALEEARALASSNGYIAGFINLYCDTLLIDQDFKILPEKDGSRERPLVLEIFARDLIRSESSSKSWFHVRMVDGSELVLWTPSAPNDFSISIEGTNMPTRIVTPQIKSGDFGVSYMYEGRDSFVETPWDASPTGMDNINYLSLIGEDGKLKDKGILNDDLPRLVQFQLLVAQAHTTLNRKLAIQLLDYVIAATSNPKSFHMNYQASTLRSNLMIDADTLSVPSVNIYASKQVLKSRLVAALAFEEAFRDFNTEARSLNIQTNTALNMLAKSSDAMQTYEFLKDLRMRDYKNAVTANEKALVIFKTRQSDLETLGNRFKRGIEKWQKDQKRKGLFAFLTAVVEIGVAIGATVATGGAAAPAVGAAVAGTVKAAGKIAQLVAKLKEIFEKLKKIYEKIKPVIEKLQAAATIVKDVVDKLNKFAAATEGPKAVKPPMSSSDVFNATAEWRRFDITIRDMIDGMSDLDYKGIDGKDDYFQALKFLVVDGETYIQTQANLVTKGDELATVLLQQKMESNDTARLAATARVVATEKSVAELLRRAMFDRILAIRTLVFLDFYTYTTAYQYHTLSNELMVTLSPVKPVVDYLEDISKLQGAVASFGSKVMIQQRPFILRSLCGHRSSKDLADALVAGKSVTLPVHHDNHIWEGFGRIRLSRARCYLEGLKAPDSPNPLRVELRTDGQFVDLDHSRVDIRYGSSLESRETSVTEGSAPDFSEDEEVEFTLTEAPSKGDDILLELDTVQTGLTPQRNFLGDPRVLLFEYVPGSNVVTCDGYYGQERDYTKHTPITNWSIRLVHGSGDILQVKDLDFSGFTGVRLEFLCDFTWRAY